MTTSETEEEMFTEDYLNARDGFRLVKSWWETCKGCNGICKKEKTRVSCSKNSCTCARVHDLQLEIDWVVWDEEYLKGRQTHIKSKLCLRRKNQRSSISQGMKVFQRSQRMQVIFAKDDQQILQCTGWLSCDNSMTKQRWFFLDQFKLVSWVHERKGFWLWEESQKSHQVSAAKTCCTSTKKQLGQGQSV